MQHDRARLVSGEPGLNQITLELDDGMASPGGRRRRSWLAATALLAALPLTLALAACGADPTGPAGDARPTPVRAALAERGDLSVRRELSGELVGEAAALSSRVPGRLESVLVRPGDRLQAGAMVAIIDAAELVQERQEQAEQIRVLEANLRRATARLDEAASQLRRGRELAAKMLISDQELERFEAQLATMRAEAAAVQAQIEQGRARALRLDEQLAETRVRAPFPGIVAQRFLDPGAVVQIGMPIIRLVQDHALLVQFRVPERLLGRLTVGAPFTVATHATGDELFPGRVVRIAGEVSRSDRAALVEGELISQDPVLLPGMYAQVKVQLEEIVDAVLVPGVAVVERLVDGEVARGVFVAPGEAPASEARWRAVQVLELEGEVAAVSGELTGGERVLTLGHEELADGSPVMVVEGPGSSAEAAVDGEIRG